MSAIIKVIQWALIVYVVAALLIWWLHPLVLFRPTALADDYSYTFKIPFRELTFETDPGRAKLNALWFSAHDSVNLQSPSSIPGKAVLFFHGNRDNLVRWGREYTERFTSRGYQVLMYDYRGYGKSTGDRSEDALHRDAQYLYDFLKKNMPEDSIIVYGYSIGTGMASRIAANNHPQRLILEAPYASIPTLGRTQLAIFPYEWLTRYKFRTDSCFAHIHCPIHLFHGTDDITVPYENSRILLTSFTPAKVRLTTLPKGHHLHLDSFPLYQATLDSLLRNGNQ
ncbi:alpha/beta hydrolase [Runella slithyformis]|uniref:Alpha/beta hydrolase fold protein n=1 Tax=Runella slithyformis (strain ATCC 29530 / DSM 19594 / LMG 11500 / NCIMB 11436 / LSU 4) TaxID=761193 RepID=A0A7U3ZHS5_RUNSL|nr:alpha/beta hydrolase [Runella slithyformis]AEI47472.1 alpha/beta hydrolase fold protein [Runella slithyformis DSM 19594]